ncbi:MAG: hypothetical protein ACRDUX_09725 [Mycobacterium sp.]
MSESEPDAVLGPFSSSGAQATPWASALAILGVAEVRNPRCVLTTGTNALSGVDVVIEGVASVVDERSEREPTVGFAFGKLPTSSQTRYTWPNR